MRVGNFGKSRSCGMKFLIGAAVTGTRVTLRILSNPQAELLLTNMSSFQGSIFTKDRTNKKKTLSRWAYFISRKWQLLITDFLDFLHILGWTIDIIWTAQLLDWDMLLTMTNQLYPLILIPHSYGIPGSVLPFASTHLHILHESTQNWKNLVKYPKKLYTHPRYYPNNSRASMKSFAVPPWGLSFPAWRLGWSFPGKPEAHCFAVRRTSRRYCLRYRPYLNVPYHPDSCMCWCVGVVVWLWKILSTLKSTHPNEATVKSSSK